MTGEGGEQLNLMDTNAISTDWITSVFHTEQAGVALRSLRSSGGKEQSDALLKGTPAGSCTACQPLLWHK